VAAAAVLRSGPRVGAPAAAGGAARVWLPVRARAGVLAPALPAQRLQTRAGGVPRAAARVAAAGRRRRGAGLGRGKLGAAGAGNGVHQVVDSGGDLRGAPRRLGGSFVKVWPLAQVHQDTPQPPQLLMQAAVTRARVCV